MGDPPKHMMPGPVRGAAWLLAVALGAGLMLGGCWSGNDEYAQTKQERDEILGELQKLTRVNDHLNLEIGRLYNECDQLSTQVALTAALAIHDRFTADLVKPKPVQPTPPARGSTATTPRPRQTGTPPAATTPRRDDGAGPAGRGGSTGSTRGGGSSAGQTTRPAPPPPPPPPPSGTNRPSGAVDWGT